MNNVGFILIGIGLACDLLGCVGLLRFPDVYSRLQVSTKCVTFGTSCILLGTAVILGLSTAGVKCLVAIIFLLITAPTSSHAIARAARRAGVKLWQGTGENAKRKNP
jgi:multicomponent Na+:H+ antiporter subunit G